MFWTKRKTVRLLQICSAFLCYSPEIFADVLLEIQGSVNTCSAIFKLEHQYAYDDVNIKQTTFLIVKELKNYPDTGSLDFGNLRLTAYEAFSEKDYDIRSLQKPNTISIPGFNYILRMIYGVDEARNSVRLNGKLAMDVPILNSGVFHAQVAQLERPTFTYHLYSMGKLSTFNGVKVATGENLGETIFSEIPISIDPSGKSFLRVENISKFFAIRELKQSSVFKLESNNDDFKLSKFTLKQIEKQKSKTKKLNYDQLLEVAKTSHGARVIHGRYFHKTLTISLAELGIYTQPDVTELTVPYSEKCLWTLIKE